MKLGLHAFEPVMSAQKCSYSISLQISLVLCTKLTSFLVFKDSSQSVPLLNLTGYGGFDEYGGYNNYAYGNDGYDDRMRDGRGKKKYHRVVQLSIADSARDRYCFDIFSILFVKVGYKK